MIADPSVPTARLTAGSLLLVRDDLRPPADFADERRDVLRAVPDDFRAPADVLRATFLAVLRAAPVAFRAVDFTPRRADEDFFAAVRPPPRADVLRDDDLRAVERLLPPRELALFFADVLREELREPDFLVAIRSSLLEGQTRAISNRLRVLRMECELLDADTRREDRSNNVTRCSCAKSRLHLRRRRFIDMTATGRCER